MATKASAMARVEEKLMGKAGNDEAPKDGEVVESMDVDAAGL